MEERRGVAPGGSAARKAAELRAAASRTLEMAEKWEKGADGERATAEALSLLPPDFVVFHDLVVPGSKANVDHLVIGPTGVWLIDSKAYQGELRFADGTLWRGRFPMRRESATVEWMATEVSRHLDADVRPVLCFTHAEPPVPCPPLGTVEVVSVWAVAQLIQHGPVVSSPAMVDWLSGLAREMTAPMPKPKERPVEALESIRRQPVAPPILIRDTRWWRRSARPKPVRAARPAPPVGGPASGSRSQPARRRRSRKQERSILGAIAALLLSGIFMKGVEELVTNRPPAAPVSALEAPNVEVQAHCDAPGAGYRVALVWPGDLEGLVGYRVRLENGFAGDLGLWRGWQTPGDLDPLVKLPPSIPVEISMVAEMTDGRRSPAGRGSITLPAQPC